METVQNTQCALVGCNTVDFLPIICPLCTLSFCKEHSFEDNHFCSRSAVQPGATGDDIGNSRISCSLPGCSDPTLAFKSQPDRSRLACPSCNLFFCTKHRHGTAHRCAQLATPPDQTGSKAKARAAKVLENIQKSKPATLSDDPVKMAKSRAIQLMKMRRTADPADPKDKDRNVPVNERLFIVLNHNDLFKPFWLRKDIGAGKALDLLAARNGIYGPSLALVLLPEGTTLRTDQPLATQITDGCDLSINIEE